MDPLIASAVIKTGVAAGKQLHNLSKEITGFFDATDGAKKAHAKKKNGIFATANEEAMATWTQAQNAKTAEAELREFIINTKGFYAYQELLKIRRDVIAQHPAAVGAHHNIGPANSLENSFTNRSTKITAMISVNFLLIRLA